MQTCISDVKFLSPRSLSLCLSCFNFAEPAPWAASTSRQPSTVTTWSTLKLPANVGSVSMVTGQQAEQRGAVPIVQPVLGSPERGDAGLNSAIDEVSLGVTGGSL